MKISCDVIKDLLPLYHDEVCSEESKVLIEEHLVSCECCRMELGEMNDKISLSESGSELRLMGDMTNLSKKWKLEMLKSLLKGVLVTVITITLIALFLYLFVDISLH